MYKVGDEVEVYRGLDYNGYDIGGDYHRDVIHRKNEMLRNGNIKAKVNMIVFRDEQYHPCKYELILENGETLSFYWSENEIRPLNKNRRRD